MTKNNVNMCLDLYQLSYDLSPLVRFNWLVFVSHFVALYHVKFLFVINEFIKRWDTY